MPKTLLLADDSVTIQKVVGITFANEDVELVTVDNGTDALARARQILPDLVLADIGMPGMDGYELCAAIRRTPELAHVPVLLLTGTFESYDEQRARSAGASGHISKPFEAQALVDRVWSLLAETEAAQAATRVADPFERIAPTPAAPAPDPFPDLPELPNSSFGARAPAAPPAGARLPQPNPSDLFDLSPGRPPLAPALEKDDPFLPTRTGRSAPLREPDLREPPAPDASNGETAFLDPFHDMTPPLGSEPAFEEPAARQPLLPPAEAPDLLDPGDFAAQPGPHPGEDTNPTYADGSRIAAGDAPDALESEESLALVTPASGHALAAAEAAEVPDLPEIDPLDLEPLEPVDARDSTLRSPAPGEIASAHGAPDAQRHPVEHALDGDALHASLEKIAWEAFGSLSQELVEQFTRRVEAILWEVVPALAERLVREEIARLKSEA
jgi:CheY-like chemotaxis protein